MTGKLLNLAQRSALFTLLISVATSPGLAREPEAQDIFFPPVSLEVANIPGIPVEIALRLKQYREIGSTKFLDWTPDSKSLLVSSHFEETSQLQYLTGARKRPHQITIRITWSMCHFLRLAQLIPFANCRSMCLMNCF